MKSLVSIIIPAYNAASYILECLESIKKQDYTKLEVIVVDDGSIDNTKALIERNYPWVRLISQKNSGPSVARNTGICEAKGDLICFVDADDVISVNMVSSLVNSIENNHVDFSACGIYMFNDQKKVTKHIRLTPKNMVIRGSSNIFKVLYPFFSTYKVNAPYGRIYKKSILLQNSIYFDEQLDLGEDSVFNMEYFSIIHSCSFIEGELYGYRRGHNYLTEKYSGSFKQHKKKRFEKMRDILKRKDLGDRFLNGQLIFIVYSYFLELPQKLHEMDTKKKYGIIQETISDPDVQLALTNFSGNEIIKILALFLKTNNPRLIYFVAKFINIFRQIIKKGK